MQPVQVQVSLDINGAAVNCLVEPRRTLLDTLRTDLNLTGTKKACDMGDCGACTVLVDGLPMYACLLLAVDCRGRQVTTIEGLGTPDRLDPVQQAFIEADGFQCGFCTPGQIMSIRALLDATRRNDAFGVAVSPFVCGASRSEGWVSTRPRLGAE